MLDPIMACEIDVYGTIAWESFSPVVDSLVYIRCPEGWTESIQAYT
jgi:hypothetical protein